MNDNHLSDDQIQNYLDNPQSSDREKIDQHLSRCSICQQTVNQYCVLYADLKIDFTPVFSKNFSRNVTTALSGSEETRWQKYESGFIVAFFLIGIAVSLYFLNPLPHLTSAGSAIVNYIREYLIKFVPDINGNLPFVIVAILIFFLVQLFDKKLIKPKI